jgi:hypothetical protein
LQISSTGTNRLEINYKHYKEQLGSIYGQLIINPNDAKNNWYNASYENITTVENGGKIVNNGGVITGAATRLQFLSGSEYQHNMNGGVVPTATWNANSLVNVTGITTTNATGFNQTLGHLTWNCTNQAGNITLTNDSFSINGNFTIISTGSDTLNLSNGSRSITDIPSFEAQNEEISIYSYKNIAVIKFKEVQITDGIINIYDIIEFSLKRYFPPFSALN